MLYAKKEEGRNCIHVCKSAFDFFTCSCTFFVNRFMYATFVLLLKFSSNLYRIMFSSAFVSWWMSYVYNFHIYFQFSLLQAYLTVDRVDGVMGSLSEKKILIFMYNYNFDAGEKSYIDNCEVFGLSQCMTNSNY